MSSDRPDLSPGDLFAGFRIEDVVGSGGMGTVYRALDLTLDHERALKVLTASLTADRAFRERFQRESQLAAQLEDEGVVPISSAGEADGRLYIAMRLVRGADLHRLVEEEGPLSLPRAAAVTAAVAQALDAAHARGIVHRDVKPANILIEPARGGERVFLTDFGISRPASGTTSITSTGQLLGTTDYISPEQIDGERPGPAADVYALGCVVCFMLTGEAPFRRETAVATLYAHANAERPRPTLLAPGLPAGVDDVVTRATAVDPGERFATAGELANALLLTVDPAQRTANAARAPVTPTTRELPTRTRRRLGPWAGVGIAAALGVVVAAILVTGGEEAPEPVDPPSAAKVREIEVGDPVDSVVVGELNVLVGSQSASSLHTIEPQTGDLAPSPKAVPHPTAVAVGFSSVWVASGTGDRIVRFGPDNRDVAIPIDVGDEPADIAVGGSWIWVANRGDHTVTQINPLDNSVEATIPVAPKPQSVVTEGDVAWVASTSAGRLTRLDAGTEPTTAQPVAVAGSPADLAIVDGSLWVADSGEGTLAQLSMEDGSPLGDPIELGGAPVALTVGPGALWAADKARDLAVRVDAETGDREMVEVGHRPVAIAVGGGSVWVANAGDRSVSRIDR